MIFPQKWSSYVVALNEAMEASVKHGTVFLYRVTEGGYVFDNIHREFSNEKLIATFKNGERVNK